MVTLLYAVVDPDGHTVQVASAGHPPPLLLDPGGRPTFVEAPAGSPLGVARYSAYEESMTTLDPSSTAAALHRWPRRGPRAAPRPGPGGAAKLDGGRAARARGALPSRARLARRPGRLQRRPRAARPSVDAARQDAQPGAARPGPPRLPRCVVRWRSGCGWRGPGRTRSTRCWSPAARRARIRSRMPIPRCRTRRSRSAPSVRAPRSRSRFATPAAGEPPGEESRGRGLAVMRELMDDVEIEPSDDGTTVRLRRRLRGEGPA